MGGRWAAPVLGEPDNPEGGIMDLACLLTPLLCQSTVISVILAFLLVLLSAVSLAPRNMPGTQAVLSERLWNGKT